MSSSPISRAIRSGQNEASSTRFAAVGPRTVSSARRAFSSTLSETCLYSPMGSSLTPAPRATPGALAARSRARWATVSANLLRGTTASTRPHSTARLPFTPSASVEKASARSRRTFRLSTTRVRPPVPGSTPSNGTSGSATVEDPSSISTMSSQASASSYPPPAVAPLQAARKRMPLFCEASSIARRVSFVYLQKLTLKGWVLEAQALDRVGQLDVDAQVVAVALQLELAVCSPERLDLHAQLGDLAVDREDPVAVLRRMGVELQLRRGGGRVHRPQGSATKERMQALYCLHSDT